MDIIYVYKYLGVKKDATDEQIKNALKERIELFCEDSNHDSDYYKQLFIESANILLDPDKRLEVDKEIENRKIKQEIEKEIGEIDSDKTEEEIAYYISKPNRENKALISAINTELLSKVLVLSKKTPFQRKIPINRLYGVFGEDNSFTFAKEGINTYNNKFYLKSISDNRKLIQHYDTIWEEEIAFNNKGINYIPIRAVKIIPNEMIYNCKVLKNEMAIIDSTIKGYISENPDLISNILPEQIPVLKKIKK